MCATLISQFNNIIRSIVGEKKSQLTISLSVSSILQSLTIRPYVLSVKCNTTIRDSYLEQDGRYERGGIQSDTEIPRWEFETPWCDGGDLSSWSSVKGKQRWAKREKAKERQREEGGRAHLRILMRAAAASGGVKIKNSTRRKNRQVSV